MNIPNLISLIRNGIIAKTPKITVKTSKKYCKFLDILVKCNYISSYSPSFNGYSDVFLDLTNKKILKFNHTSKPSYSLYYSRMDLQKFDRDLGLLILNTSNGIISHKVALQKGVGGECLAYLV